MLTQGQFVYECYQRRAASEAVAFAIIAIVDGGRAIGADPADQPPLGIGGQGSSRLAAAGADLRAGGRAAGHVAAGIVLRFVGAAANGIDKTLCSLPYFRWVIYESILSLPWLPDLHGRI